MPTDEQHEQLALLLEAAGLDGDPHYTYDHERPVMSGHHNYLLAILELLEAELKLLPVEDPLGDHSVWHEHAQSLAGVRTSILAHGKATEDGLTAPEPDYAEYFIKDGSTATCAATIPDDEGDGERACGEAIHYDEDLGDWQHDELTTCQEPTPVPGSVQDPS